MSDEIRVLAEEELGEAVGTPGLRRRVAVEDDDYWFGHVEAAPETFSGWHHHGDNVTLAYVLRGTVRFEYGPGGTRVAEAHEGQYLRVPAGLVHREGNLEEQAAEIIIVRVGEGPPVINVDGPEPA